MGNEDFTWKWNDPAHLEAHRHEFCRPVEEILKDLRPLAAALRDEGNNEGEDFQHDWQLEKPTGRLSLREVDPLGSDSFWAPRPGREIISHLCHGETVLTHWICLWGRWEDDAFLIHTIYPGRRAPREIHDPNIEPEKLSEAIEFWRKHAIIVDEDYRA